MERQTTLTQDTQRAQDVSGATADAAKDLAGVAKERSGEITREVKQQAGEVVRAAGEQTKHVIDQVRTRAQDEMQKETEHLAEVVGDLAGHVRALLDGRPDEAGPLTPYLQRAADGLESASQKVRETGPHGLMQAVTSFGRQHPGAFLGATALAGFSISRLMRAASDTTTNGASQGGISAEQRKISLAETVSIDPIGQDEGLSMGMGAPIPGGEGPGGA